MSAAGPLHASPRRGAAHAAHPMSGAHAGHLLRVPGVDDGRHIHALVQACPPLDVNSLYAYLLVATHFAATSVVAVRTGQGDGAPRIEGFISAYLPPGQDDTLFVWQVAVHEDARGCGLAQRMLANLLDREATRGVRFVETSVSPGNAASRQMFQRFAQARQAEIRECPWFTRAHFGAQAHEDEPLLRIGSLDQHAP